MFFKNKYFKNTICWIVILALLLQSFPLQAKAGFLEDIFTKLMEKIRLPDELKIEEDGDVMLGSWRLAKCIYTDDEEGCVNPFSVITLGKSQVSLIKDGRPNIPRPKIPEICELKIPLPPEEEPLSKEERRALSKACSDFRRIQRAAANTVYFARKIFNNTDPFSECLFLRNCKTSCYLRFGEISYIISWVDIVIFFVPAGWVNTIRKIFNFISKLNEIRKLFDQLKTTINSAIRFVNDLFKQAAYLKTFYDSLTNLLNVEGGMKGFQDLLYHYSNNLLKFSQAKSESLSWIGDAQRESLVLISELENEEGVEFLFGYDAASRDKREELRIIIDSYRSNFATLQQMVNLLRENGKSLDEEDVPIITYPEGPPSCHISASTIPRDCSVSLSEEECILYCPEKIYRAHYTYVDAFHTYDIPPFGSMGPMAYERLYYELTARDCVVEHIEGEDCGSNECYFNISCPEREYRLSYPQDFGIHTITFEEPAAGFTIQTGESEYTKIPVEVTITCPGDYTVYYYYPTYFFSKPYNWFEAFTKIYDESDVSIPYMHSDNVFDLFEELKYLQGVLSEKTDGLPLTEEELYPWENEGERKYWITETFTVEADTLQEAEEQAINMCEVLTQDYNVCNPILVYTDWDSKIKTIEEINFDPIIEARDRVPPTVLLPGGYYYESDLTVTFLTEPFVIFKADLVIATTTEVERKIEEAKPKCQDVHLSDGGWEYCPAGKFVSGVRKNWDSNANYIRCCDLPEEGVATPSCEEVHLSDGGWEHCPAGKFVSGVRKNWDSNANYIQCCDLPEEATSSPSCEEVHLSDGGWEYCSSSEFVSGVRKNWDSHANYIQCCDLPEERIPEQSFEDFETVLDGIRELRGKIEDLKNYFVRLNELWPEEEGGEEGYSAKTYVENIIETKEISQDIVTTIGESEIIFNLILSLEDDLLATPGLPAENREIIEQVFAPTGPLKGEVNEFLFEGPASIKNFAGVYECPGEGFLGNLKCFEENNGKTFEEIWHFINATEKLEEVILSFSTTTKQVYQIRPTLEIQPLQIDTSADDLFKEGKMEINFGREGVDSFSDFKDKLLQTPLSYLDDLFYGNQIPGIDNYLDDIITLLGGFIETSIDSRLQARFDNNKAFLIGFLNDETRLLEKFTDEVNKIQNEKCPTIERIIFGDENLKPGCKALDLILGLNPEDIECDCKDKSEYCENGEEKGKLDYLLIYNLAEERTQKCNLRYEIISQCGQKPVQYTPEGAITVEYWEWLNCISWIDPLDFGIETLYPETLKIEVSSEEFKEKCIELDYQKALKEECDSYEILKTALVGSCDVWEYEPYKNYCQKLEGDISKLISYFPGWGGSIPDLTSTSSKEQLNEVRRFCATELNDIRTPLEEVMMVYSVLLGIKSGTLFFRGIRTSTEDAKRVYQDAQKFIAMIKELPAKLKETSGVSEAETKSGVSIDAIRCIETPATGWGGLTGPRGGPVCPRIDYLFSIVESNFAIMRQNLIHMDMVRRRKEWIDIEVGTFRASLIATYPIKYHSVDDIYEEAEDIRNRVRDLWAIATAINFANANCTCGQSFCELPLCISGIPLTLSPLKDPYCYLVYILRYPLLKVAENLENFIK